MLKAAVGQSEDVLVKEAVNEILDQIHDSLGDTVPQAGILFCALDFDHAYILSAIRSAFPSIELIGCTTDGEISSVHGFSEDSIVLMVFASDTIKIQAGIGKNVSLRGKDAGNDAALTARKGLQEQEEDERFAIILTDPLFAGVSDINNGIEEVLGENFPLIGAVSAAHSKKRTTFQFYNDEVVTDSVALLLFSGPILYSFGIRGGHKGIGGKELVTSAEKNVLYRIGDQPALNYFRRYIGTDHNLFMNYCLAVFEQDRKGFYVRSAPFCDIETCSVTLNGVVPEGAYVQIGTADKNTCVDSCSYSIQMALDHYPVDKPSAAIHFSCAGRKMIMGTQVEKEIQTVKKFLGGIPFCGFYAYGEICPLEKDSKSMFHGTTFITLLIGEA